MSKDTIALHAQFISSTHAPWQLCNAADTIAERQLQRQKCILYDSVARHHTVKYDLWVIMVDKETIYGTLLFWLIFVLRDTSSSHTNTHQLVYCNESKR